MRHDIRHIIIGASLSEPHTSVTAFAEVVCMSDCACLWPYTVNFKLGECRALWGEPEQIAWCMVY